MMKDRAPRVPKVTQADRVRGSRLMECNGYGCNSALEEYCCYVRESRLDLSSIYSLALEVDLATA